MRPDRAPSTAHVRWLPGPVNAALLALSFALGQGSIFLVQTWMIDRDALALLASFATHFSFAILALMIVDMGSPVVVARRISLAQDHEVMKVVRRCYWQACAVRLCVAALVSLAGLGYVLFSSDEFSRRYIPSAMPALFQCHGSARRSWLERDQRVDDDVRLHRFSYGAGDRWP